MNFYLFGNRRIKQLEEALEVKERLIKIQQQGWHEMEDRYKDLAKAIAINSRAMARVIAKVDPTYAQDEADPARRKASDALGDEVIRKLTAEDHFSNRTRGY